jgi:hypothetical protein
MVGQDTEFPFSGQYRVRGKDVEAGQIRFEARISGGLIHLAPQNASLLDIVQTIGVFVGGACDDSLFCNGREFCDPAASDGVRVGLCQPSTPPDCGSSDQCADRGCDEETDGCFEVDTGMRCGESDFCVERGCDPDLGCVALDSSDVVCPGAACNPATATCDP